MALMHNQQQQNYGYMVTSPGGMVNGDYMQGQELNLPSSESESQLNVNSKVKMLLNDAFPSNTPTPQVGTLNRPTSARV